MLCKAFLADMVSWEEEMECSAWDIRGGTLYKGRAPTLEFTSPETTTMNLAKLTVNPDEYFAKMPPRTAGFNDLWEFLSAGIDHIMNSPEIGLSYAGYIGIYTIIFNYCTSHKVPAQWNRDSCTFVNAVLISVSF